ncbi:MAG: holo-ACP synthase [bacterium]
MEIRKTKNIDISIGTDIINNQRIKKHINDPKFIQRILGDKEIQIFSKFTNERRKIEFLAARFSAKESITKALKFKPVFNKINILTDSSILIQPEYLSQIKKNLNFKNLQIKVSISHEKEYTISNCIILYTKNKHPKNEKCSKTT